MARLALARGAEAVMIGRATFYGVCAGGELLSPVPKKIRPRFSSTTGEFQIGAGPGAAFSCRADTRDRDSFNSMVNTVDI